jgi:hypothetical protein
MHPVERKLQKKRNDLWKKIEKIQLIIDKNKVRLNTLEQMYTEMTREIRMSQNAGNFSRVKKLDKRWIKIWENITRTQLNITKYTRKRDALDQELNDVSSEIMRHYRN